MKRNHRFDFIILSRCYKPGSAPSNRLLSFLRGFDNLGIHVRVIFAYPNKEYAKITESYHYIDIEYLWQNDKPVGKVRKYVRSLFRIAKLSKQLKKGTRVFLVDEQTYLPILTFNKGLSIFHERTENPELINKLPFGLQNIYYHSCKKTKCIFCISTALSNFFKEKGVKQTAIINMTVDPERFNIEKQNQQDKYIAYCGTVSNDKDGVDILLRSFAKISSKYSQIKLYIIGHCPKTSEFDLNMRLIEELGIKDKVILTGPIPYIEMPKILKNASVLALARPESLQATYGFPTKLGEYLLTGNPVVITSVGDIPRFLKHKESALLCKPNSIEDFSLNIDWVLEHYDEAIKIGERGRQVALKEFNATNETLKIYNIISTDK